MKKLPKPGTPVLATIGNAVDVPCVFKRTVGINIAVLDVTHGDMYPECPDDCKSMVFEARTPVSKLKEA